MDQSLILALDSALGAQSLSTPKSAFYICQEVRKGRNAMGTTPRAGTRIAVEVKQGLREVALWIGLSLALIQKL